MKLITPSSAVVDPRRLRISLLLLRLGIFLVMFFWSVDKIVQPDHAAAVFGNFYLIGNISPFFLTVIGFIQILVLLAFLSGFAKTWSYGLVLAMHTVSTLSSWKQYLAPFDNLLFFAAWPMLAACVALFLLRGNDNLLSLDSVLSSKNAR